jgi:hypothetical protein
VNTQAFEDMLAAHRGPFYYERLSLADWAAARPGMTRCSWLTMTTTDCHGNAADVVLIATGRPRGAAVQKIGPTRAADLARLWLKYRRPSEVEASPEWAQLLDLPGRRPPAPLRKTA